jgi:hypothetical protein
MAGGGQAKLARHAVEATERAHRPAEVCLDAQEIRELLEFFAREGLSGRITNGATTRSAQIASVDATRGVMSLELSGDLKGPGTATLELSHLHLNYTLSVAHDGKSSPIVRIPDHMIKTVRRAARRSTPPGELTLSFEGPGLGTNGLSAPVLDLSRTGLSFAISYAEAAPYTRGLVLRFSLSTATGKSARFTGSVKSFREQAAQIVIGLEIQPAEPSAAHLLEEELESALYPGTRCRDLDVWDVYASSGYLELSGKHPKDFADLRRAYDNTARKLEEARDVASVACSPREGIPVAVGSHLKLYQSTWLVCQLSKRKLTSGGDSNRDALREIYLRIYETAQADGDTRWLLAYVQDLAPSWSKRLHIEVPQRYVASGDGCLVPFRALETHTDPERFFALARERGVLPRFQVAENHAELGRLAARDLYRIRPAQYLDALDLTADRLSLAGTTARWRRAGLRRERSVLIASDGGSRCAMAVLERAERGAHLYGLLDCVRMYPLRLGGERAFAALLAEAHRWYQRRAIEQFVWLDESNMALPAFDLGFRDLGKATLTLLSIDRLPELMQGVADLSSKKLKVVSPRADP